MIVTGGIASGKSALCRSFATERDEWEIFDADQAVHGLLTTAQIKLRIADRFGVGILDAGGEIDRRMLGSIVFADSAARRDLETILHPEVFRLFCETQSGAENAGVSVLVADIPLYFESQRKYSSDLVIAIATSSETQHRRLSARNSLSAERAKSRISAQLPAIRKLEWADLAIWNEGSLSALNDQAKLAILRIEAL